MLRRAIGGGTEVIDGQTFEKVVLPEQTPSPKRGHTSRYHLYELRGEGLPPKKKQRRRKSKSRRTHEQREKDKRVL